MFDWFRYTLKRKPTYSRTEDAKTASQFQPLYIQLMQLTKAVKRKNKLINRLRNELAYTQARLDGYMNEFTPEDMTERQIKEWASHQVKSDLELPVAK